MVKNQRQTPLFSPIPPIFRPPRPAKPRKTASEPEPAAVSAFNKSAPGDRSVLFKRPEAPPRLGKALNFTQAAEFADVDFNEERLEKRLRKMMETLSKDPQKSIYGSSANRAEAKLYTIYSATISLTRAKYCRPIVPRQSGVWKASL
jgi:hypothetical protein